MKKAILVLREFKEKQLEDLKQFAPNYDVVESIREVEPEAIEIVVGWSNQLLPIIKSEQSNIKWIQQPYAGVNNLPLELLKEKNILLTNGSGLHAHAVTETTMGLLLGMTRKVIESSKNQEAKKWASFGSLYELSGKTMLIVGAGKIGEQLGRVAQAFDLRTIGINRSGRKINYMDEQYVQTELPAVVKHADIVVNILPDTEETKNLYDAELFDQMKNDAYFINVGRGATVVTADLLAALDQGKFRGVGLDVFEEEPLPATHPLWTHERVVITPHIAGHLEDYGKSLYPLFIENLKAFIKREELPRNRVQLQDGY